MSNSNHGFVLGLALISGTALAEPEHRVGRDEDSKIPGRFAPWLASTDLIDKDSQAVRETAAQLVAGVGDERQRALAIYRFVRDRIDFGWTGRFYDMKASQVLSASRGYCNTKATLFIALLRAEGIPARQRFVDLRSDVLRGLVETGGPYVDHSYTEVWLGGRWLGVDSYVLDPTLFNAAARKLSNEGRQLGYGLHSSGINDWDGNSNSFAQFVNDGSASGLSTVDYGVFADVEDFYAKVPSARNRRGGLRSLALRLLLPLANQRVEAVRRQATQIAD